MITIYGKANCMYCEMTKAFLDRKGVPYQYLKLNEDYLIEDLRKKVPTARTFPQIFSNGINIGGYNEMVTNWERLAKDSSGNMEYLKEG